jgi:hypothetical protein
MARQLGPAYPNDFARENTAGKINDLYDGKRSEELDADAGRGHASPAASCSSG